MAHAETALHHSGILSHQFADSMDAIILCDDRLRVTLFNRTAELMFGCSTAQAAGLNVSKFMPGLSDHLRGVPDQSGTGWLCDLTGVRRNNSTFAARANITAGAEHGGPAYVLSVRDMTETLATKNRLERLGCLYVTRAQFRQTLRRTLGRQEMLLAACNALVTCPGFRLSWIGWHVPQTGALVVVAEAGVAQGYLSGLDVSVGEKPNGQGPSDVAFSEGRPVIVADLQNNTSSLPWKAKAKEVGLRSSSAYPIWMQGKVRGTLNVYSDAPDAFQTEEVALLAEVAADISAELDDFIEEERRENTEALARRERQFSDALVESMPGVCFLCTEQGRFLRWNHTFEAVSGYGADEIARMNLADFFPATERDQLLQNAAKVFAVGHAVIDGTLVPKTGAAIAHFFTGQRIMFDGVHCIIGVGIDITDLRLAQNSLAQSEARYRTTLDSILEACQLIGFDGRYKYLNDAAAVQTRRPNAQLLGKTMHEVWQGAEQMPVFKMVKNCMTWRIASNQECEFNYPEGGTAWFDVRVEPVPEGVFVLSIDITERRMAEYRLLALNADLENRICLRTTELQSAVMRAESSDRTKSVFLATMSHELRTPLNSIIGFSGIMMMGLAGPLNDEQRKQLGIVQSSAKHLLALVNDILDISTIEAGHLKVFLQPFNIAPSVEKVAASLMDMALLKGLTLNVVWDSAPVTLVSDQRRFEQILLNLINNAVKFTEAGGVAVHIDLDPPATHLRIRVIDTGTGILLQDLPSLFLPFRQIDGATAHLQVGTGLGLAICNRLIDYLAGQIEVESEFGKGSTFTVRFPLTAKEC